MRYVADYCTRRCGRVWGGGRRLQHQGRLHLHWYVSRLTALDLMLMACSQSCLCANLVIWMKTCIQRHAWFHLAILTTHVCWSCSVGSYLCTCNRGYEAAPATGKEGTPLVSCILIQSQTWNSVRCIISQPCQSELFVQYAAYFFYCSANLAKQTGLKYIRKIALTGFCDTERRFCLFLQDQLEDWEEKCIDVDEWYRS
jgi:hypothetical protein